MSWKDFERLILSVSPRSPCNNLVIRKTEKLVLQLEWVSLREEEL
jgi:hypothetical protein